MPTMALPTASCASPANPKKVLLVALLCAAASFVPCTSADASLITQICRRTRHKSLCVSVLQSANGTSAAATVQDLASAALKSARRATIRAKLDALDLVYNGTAANGTALGDLMLQCNAMYSACLREGAKVMAMVSTGTFHGGADAAAALRVFPERCEALFRARRVASPLEKVNREVEDKLEVSYEIVRLLH